jgi:hypothetical protein
MTSRLWYLDDDSHEAGGLDDVTVRALVNGGEGQRVEFKTSFAEQNQAIQSLCAFAHADGGSVIFGVEDDGTIVGVQMGRKTLEDFSQVLRTNTEPQLYPDIRQVPIDGQVLVIATIPKAGPGELFHAFKVAYIRVGKTNEVMSSQEQRKRLLEGQAVVAEDGARPRFGVIHKGGNRGEGTFQPEFHVKQFSGELVANLRWRIRGPRFSMDWGTASGAALDRTVFTRVFDIASVRQPDDVVNVNNLAFEVKFHWHARWRSELHQWPLNRRQVANKVLWDIGEEILPPLELDDPPDETHVHDDHDECSKCGMVECDHCHGWFVPRDSKCNICGSWQSLD